MTHNITTLTHDLGTFEGFNFRSQSAIEQTLDANEVVGWDHDAQGEAEFWPSGDHDGTRLVLGGRSTVTPSQLIGLDRLLTELGDDSLQSFARIRQALDSSGMDLAELNVEAVEDQMVHVFEGSNFTDLRRDAAYELFEAYFPELYRLWESTPCDGLIFDTDRFLDSPSWSVSEYPMGTVCILTVAPA